MVRTGRFAKHHPSRQPFPPWSGATDVVRSRAVGGTTHSTGLLDEASRWPARPARAWLSGSLESYAVAHPAPGESLRPVYNSLKTGFQESLSELSVGITDGRCRNRDGTCLERRAAALVYGTKGTNGKAAACLIWWTSGGKFNGEAFFPNRRVEPYDIFSFLLLGGSFTESNFREFASSPTV
jgi:hypothetical protein